MSDGKALLQKHYHADLRRTICQKADRGSTAAICAAYRFTGSSYSTESFPPGAS